MQVKQIGNNAGTPLPIAAGCQLYRILTFDQALKQPEVKLLDQLHREIQFQLSWSSDRVCWTNWVPYDQYKLLTRSIESDFYLRLRFSGILSAVLVDGTATSCYSITWEPMNLTGDPCRTVGFNPYTGLDCALDLQLHMSDTIICTFGIPIYYIRISPEESSADYTFKEFKLHNVVDIKQLKLMVSDGQMPSSNPRLSDLDFDWEVDWETELSKTQFATAFGDTVVPKQRDIIYIPMMGRVWQVNSAYDEKQGGLLWRSTTWKLALIKYQDSTNVDKNIFEGIIDNFVGSTWENTFGDLEENEQERESGYKQVKSPERAANNLYNLRMEDAIRDSYTKNDLLIIEKTYCHHNNIITRNIYKPLDKNAEVVYQKGYCGEEGTIYMLIETPGYTDVGSRTVASFGPIEFQLGYGELDYGNEYVFGVEDLYVKLDMFSVYLIEYRWSKERTTRELRVFGQKHRMDLPVYMIRLEDYWFDFENPVGVARGEYNDDYIVCKPEVCRITPWPLLMGNIKLYNRYLDDTSELVKYTTTDDRCVFNDLARPVNSGLGYSVK